MLWIMYNFTDPRINLQRWRVVETPCMINSHVLMLTHVCSMALNSKYDRTAILYLGQRKRHWWELGCLSTKPWWCMVERINIPRVKFYVGWRWEGQKSNLPYGRFTYKQKAFFHPFLPPVLHKKTRYFTQITGSSFSWRIASFFTGRFLWPRVMHFIVVVKFIPLWCIILKST